MRAGSASGSRKTTRSRHVPPSTSVAPRTTDAQRAPAALATGQQAVDEQLQRALELRARGRLRQLEPLLQALAGDCAGRSGVSRPRARSCARSPGAAEAIGDRGARQRGQRAERARSRGARAARAAPRSPRSGAAAPTGSPARSSAPAHDAGTAGARARGGGHDRAEARRAGAEAPAPTPARRSAARVAREHAVERAAVQAPQPARPRSRRARERPGSTCAPMPSRRASTRSQASATPTGIGRDERQPRAARERLAHAHARMDPEAPRRPRETSPTSCSRPGSGASAAGPCSSAARPPAATASSKRGSRTQTIRCEHMFACSVADRHNLLRNLGNPYAKDRSHARWHVGRALVASAHTTPPRGNQ